MHIAYDGGTMKKGIVLIGGSEVGKEKALWAKEESLAVILVDIDPLAPAVLYANFFINRHQASCDQMLRLIDLAQKKVNQFCGLALEPEVLIWGQGEDN